ncbi:ABC transporter substrate-binding protein [Psychrobacter aestuarii]|uniref:ABC transporter substrate-binding protein n=1 Tax=Psychrobacter aestuarii TaxID=556327 RepID=A0ABN0VJS4_9GAMM|nr:ABC transporter substrate-binding protein [Psychrobacter aestuarii]
MKKTAIVSALLILAGLAWYVFSNNSTAKTGTNGVSSAAAGDADKGQNLIVVTPWELTSLDTSTTGFIFQRMQLAETLVDASQDAQLQPMLAKSWSSNDAGDVWTFVLRDGVQFHNGAPLTAADVVKSLTIALQKPTALKAAQIADIRAIDDKTVELTLEKPLMSLPAYLAHATSMILSSASFADNGEVTQLIGTGPYQLTRFEPPQKLEQQAFANYWGKPAKIKNVSYLANSRSETRTLLAQSKPNYLVFTLDPASLNRLQQDPNVQVVSKSLARTIQYKVNADNPLFRDVNVRQALSDAIDRQGIAQSVMHVKKAAAEQILPPIFADWQIPAPTKQPDPAAIKQRLIDLGFTVDDQGMLYKDGKPFAFTLRTFSDRPELPLIATALQAQWKKIGVAVDVSVGNFSEIPSGHQDGSLEMALYARNYGLTPDPVGSLLEDFAPAGSDWGVMNWQSPALNTDLQVLETSTAPEHATKQQISKIIHDARPITPVVYYQQNAAAHTSLQGLEIDALERNFYLSKLSWAE